MYNVYLYILKTFKQFMTWDNLWNDQTKMIFPVSSQKFPVVASIDKISSAVSRVGDSAFAGINNQRWMETCALLFIATICSLYSDFVWLSSINQRLLKNDRFVENKDFCYQNIFIFYSPSILSHSYSQNTCIYIDIYIN